jgi:phytoene dehydrogenase-like protein
MREVNLEKSIIIIGGGLAGLSTGCYGQMNGYKTTIFEMHKKAGGVATAWKRKGYTIDGAMNWLVGTMPGSQFYTFWEELGATGKWKIFNHDRYMVSQDKEGRTFSIYCDADRFEKYLLELAPEDSGPIKEFTQAIRTSSNFNMPVDKPEELWDESDRSNAGQNMTGMQTMQKWAVISTHDFAKRLKNPYLRGVFEKMPPFSMTMFIWLLGFQHSKSAGYVIGGALALVKSIEKRYLKLGGDIHFNSRVEKILVENDKAVGVKLANGKEYRADYIVSAGDGHTTIFEMLGGRYIDDKIREMYAKPNLFPPLVYVGLGVKGSFKDLPCSIDGYTFPLTRSINIAGKEETSMTILAYDFDPTLSPAGKNVAVVRYTTDYDYWHSLKKYPAQYKAEKERIAKAIIAGLEERFPGITEQVEMYDVATPVTWERFTGNWRGSYEGWMFGSVQSIKKTLPGLDNFYMAGQWVNPGGGMPTAAMSGNHTIQFICKKDNREFVTTKP